MASWAKLRKLALTRRGPGPSHQREVRPPVPVQGLSRVRCSQPAPRLPLHLLATSRSKDTIKCPALGRAGEGSRGPALRPGAHQRVQPRRQDLGVMRSRHAAKTRSAPLTPRRRFLRRAPPPPASGEGALDRAWRPAHGPRSPGPGGGGGRGARLRSLSSVQALADIALSRPERKAAVTVTR